uniref:MIF4G domain-containing protein n=1 Tax=Heterorhabditis bacteriophora TaxID=37862 RepID=A0A1I7X3M7_HETBA
MSNTIPRGKGRGKPVIQEGNALNVGGPHSNGAPIGALAQQQPPYVTPSVPMHMPPPGPDYNSGPHYVTNTAQMFFVGAAPHQTQQPHTFRPPNNAYYTQQPYQYAQSPFPYQQQYQYGADSDPFMQHPQPMFQNQMMMAQSMNASVFSTTTTTTKKNVLTIQDPNSGEVINKQEATSDPKNNDEKTVPIAEENVHTEEAAHATAVRKQFAQQIQEQMGGTHRKSVSESSTISNMDLAGSTEVSETTMRSDTTVANKSTVEEVAVKEELKEKEHNIENETASSISVKETASFVTVKETPIVEVTPVKQTLTDDTLVESDESPLHPVPASVQPEMSPSSASEPIEEESAADVDVVSAEPAESSVEKSDAEIEVVGEEFPVDADLPEASYPDAEEEERRKAEEEAERKRAREAELDALLESLLSKPEEVDSTSLSYGRSFLYCVRDIEKEFKRTSCPLTNDALVQLGIDLSSMPKSGDGKIRPHNFNPSWLNSTRPSGSRPTRPYGGRFSQHNEARGTGAGRGGGGHKKFPPSARPSIERNIERVVPLHKSENAWKAEKIRPEDMDKEEARVKVENELKENQKLSRFRNALLNRAQQTFVSKTQEEEREKKVKTMEDEEDPKKKQQLKIDLQESDNRFRRRKFGNITFIGQLFRQSLLSTKIVQWCLYELMRHSHPAENGVIPEPPYDEVCNSKWFLFMFSEVVMLVFKSVRTLCLFVPSV